MLIVKLEIVKVRKLTNHAKSNWIDEILLNFALRALRCASSPNGLLAICANQLRCPSSSEGTIKKPAPKGTGFFMAP